MCLGYGVIMYVELLTTLVGVTLIHFSLLEAKPFANSGKYELQHSTGMEYLESRDDSLPLATRALETLDARRIRRCSRTGSQQFLPPCHPG